MIKSKLKIYNLFLKKRKLWQFVQITIVDDGLNENIDLITNSYHTFGNFEFCQRVLNIIFVDDLNDHRAVVTF